MRRQWRSRVIPLAYASASWMLLREIKTVPVERLYGGVCAKQLGIPVDDLLRASSRACVLVEVKMNGRSEPLNIQKGPEGVSNLAM